MFDEHLGYIADRTRLDLFKNAIARTIGPGDLVVDAGCGFGVLGLMCLEAGAGHVWGIDQTSAVEVARETALRAGHGASYTCIRETVGRAALPEPVDVAICDHVGYFGVDYGVIKLLAEARRFLKPGGVILPRKLRLYLAGASSPKAREEAEAWAAETIPSSFHWLRQHGINTKRRYTFARDEIATDPAVLGQVDLAIDQPERLAYTARLTAPRNATIDGFAGWFECELAEDVWMTNSPLASAPIGRPQVFLPFDRPIEVAAGDVIDASISIRHDDNLIGWSVRSPDGRRQKHSNWDSQALALPELASCSNQLPHLSASGKARQMFYRLLDGERTLGQVQNLMETEASGLFATRSELERFVRSEWARSRA